MSPTKQGRRAQDAEVEPEALSTVPGDRRGGNGKRWWKSTWLAAAAAVIVLAATGAAQAAWGGVVKAVAATLDIYDQVPRHDQLLMEHEREIKALQAERMPPGLAGRLDEFLRRQEKGKPK